MPPLTLRSDARGRLLLPREAADALKLAVVPELERLTPVMPPAMFEEACMPDVRRAVDGGTPGFKGPVWLKLVASRGRIDVLALTAAGGSGKGLGAERLVVRLLGDMSRTAERGSGTDVFWPVMNS